MTTPISFWRKILHFYGYLLFGGMGLLLAGIFYGGVLAGLGSNSVPQSSYSFVEGSEESKNEILLMPVHGVILGSASVDSPFAQFESGAAYGYEIKEALREAAKEKHVKGVVMEFDTPGGTIYGAQAIFDGIREYKEKTGQPVIAYVQGMSASGGVWAMVGADAIYADRGSMVGAIGVLGPTLMFYNKPKEINGGLFSGGITTEEGIEATTISAGRSKDMGNPFRRPTEEEISSLKADIETEYTIFVEHVAAARKIEPDVIRNEMGALVFGNERAAQLKLIDGTKNRTEVAQLVAEKAGLGEDYALVTEEPEYEGWQKWLLSRLPLQATPQANSNAGQTNDCGLLAQRVLAYHGPVSALCR